jgi:hypothetical protein
MKKILVVLLTLGSFSSFAEIVSVNNNLKFLGKYPQPFNSLDYSSEIVAAVMKHKLTNGFGTKRILKENGLTLDDVSSLSVDCKEELIVIDEKTGSKGFDCAIMATLKD